MRVRGSVIVSLMMLTASTCSLRAQGTLLPPVIEQPSSTRLPDLPQAIEPATVAPPLSAPTNAPPVCSFDRAMFAPNMFGPVLGTRWFGSSAPGNTRTVSGFIRSAAPGDALFFQAGPTTLQPITFGTSFQGVQLPLGNYTSQVPIVGQTTLPIFENSAHTAAIQAGLAKGNEVAKFDAKSYAIGGQNEDSIYRVFLVYDFITNRTTLLVPNPVDGGLAGRNRVSTDASPLPRDRVYFDYDFVQGANLYPTTPTMNRIVVGLEKTFWNGLASVELRVPFAATLNSTSNSDGTFGSGHTEFGNLFIVTKLLFYSNEACALSGGLGFSIPTADDVSLNNGGPDIVRIHNEALILTPFLASLWTPTDRMFAQTWLGFSFDTNGNPAQSDLTGKGLHTAGRLYDPTTLQLDMQLGYWLISPSERHGALRGSAPFVEFHYNQQLQAQNVVTDGALSLTSAFGQLSEFNFSAGFVTQLHDNANLMLGASFPLTNADNRFSDWQIGLRFNYFFGAAGRTRANMFN